MPHNSTLNAGSQWNRWEPHIHAPGTVLADEYKGGNPWEDYLAALEKVSPAIRAIGITDYYSVETYERVMAEKKAGRLSGIDLIFPNVELRLDLGTVKHKYVNVHLLVSPEQPDHLDQLHRFLRRIVFKAYEETFTCEKADLIKLGRASDKAIKDDGPALVQGTKHFKVGLDVLRDAFKNSAWATDNILVAVAGSETDGSSGLRDASDGTVRLEVEKLSHVIFASSVQQREFWLGQGTLSADEVVERYHGLKPCLHGSDAHALSKVGKPDGDRFCWIKGALTFDALRQAAIDPRGRAFVGDAAPVSAIPSQVIESVEIEGADWAQTKRIPLNAGLVAIIGARGSGKTALADMIALGCDAIPDPPSESSFLVRAKDLLEGTAVSVRWQEGEVEKRWLSLPESGFEPASPRARYLSQQFVEQLCSAQEMTDTLLKEIERVIFSAHPTLEREGAINFEELLDIRVSRYRENRTREETALAEISDKIGVELEKKSLIGELEKQVADKAKLVKNYEADRKKLATKGSEDRLAKLNDLMEAADKVKEQVRLWSNNVKSLLGLQDEVEAVRQHEAPQTLQDSKEKYPAAYFKDDEWNKFLLDFTGDVDGALVEKLRAGRKSISDWKGTPPPANPDPAVSYLLTGVALEKMPLAILEAEIARLEQQVNVDKETTRKFTNVSKRLTEEKAALQKLEEKFKDYQGAAARHATLVGEREATYQRVFETVKAEEQVLRELYQPLMNRLALSGGTLKKLSFSVAREVDLDAWAKSGEDLFDQRRRSPARGKGSLQQLASENLEPAWKSGSPDEVGAAMSTFQKANAAGLLETAIVAKSDPGYRGWLKKFAKWLYSTDHIRIRYSVDYEGVDIRKLSQGTRGIVLLLLYLALDEDDDRPLIIDQPEENLDPKSIYEELVGLFRQAKSRRQVIMVTHNANLVVNADADQIIIAEAGPHAARELPPITYTSGGLEDEKIRKVVCDILEGGERAFQERARRLRVKLSRS